MSEASEELVITTLLARLCEGQEKTLKALDAINSRVNALESKPQELVHHPQGIIDPSQPRSQPRPPAPQELAMRCEKCNDIYTAMPPAFGTPKNCPECAIPGRVQAKCKCGRIFSVVPGESQEKCRKCRKCFVCGTKESREVCAECQMTKKARACEACNRLASANSAFCDECQAAFGRQSAGNFADPKIPPDPRAMQEGTLAEMSGLRFADAAPAYPR